ncbi:MAG: hypothetical protein P8P74_08200 [Crocinitomicaceae bacterium]|nr:hypothetical protein [Crocinitomicaceae bacterium]
MSIESILQFVCTAPVREPARYLTREEAVLRYNDKKDVPENPNLAGFHFNLDTIKQFISEIDKHNETAQEDFQIKGIRIWKSKSLADDGSGPQLLDDLVLTPTIESETDLHGTCEGKDVAPQNSTEGRLLMLGSARPCPNLCGHGPSFYHELDTSECPE